ncbi:MAG: helix turn helix multiple antibiotic resistance protein [Chitinophagaceae bacterium]|nr:helix turn helix multiple antibiotic resistance protein [Chitinophagaceae bacterium]
MNNQDLKSILGISIIYTGKIMVNRINKYFVESGMDITTEQMGMLFYICDHEDRTVIQQDLAELMDKDKSAVLRTVDILEKKLFVKREPFDNDRRKNIIVATKEGRKIVEKAVNIFRSQQEAMIKTIDKKDIDTCMEVLKKIQLGCSKQLDPCE